MNEPAHAESSNPTVAVTTTRAARWRHSWVVKVAALLLLASAALTVTGYLVLPSRISAWAEEELVARMSRHFDGEVAVEQLEISYFPLRVIGQSLTLRQRGRDAHPPLIAIASFEAQTSLRGLAEGRVERVELDGLQIFIPPDAPDDSKPVGSANADRRKARDATAGDGRREGSDDSAAGTDPERRGQADAGGLTIGTIVSTNAVLTIAPDDADGTAQIFDIRRVDMRDFTLDGPAEYSADLINPRPRGPIASRGKFGPWNRRTPRLTPLEGEYTMDRADMSVFKGIAGTLTAQGSFGGVLESIDVKGRSTMPDFSVDVGRHPMRLDTEFDARVDGTNGNTYLNRVDATLGESSLVAKGAIAGIPGVDGKRILLDVVSDAGRLEDFIYLVVNERESPLSGRIHLETTLDLPPGDRPVPERIRLDGHFTISEGRFANVTVQKKIDELSRRGQGKPTATEIEDVVSTFSGRYTLRDGVLRLPRLGFQVSGAEVRIGGQYTLRSAALAFNGHLRLAAPLSATVTGYKSWLLKAVDPFFRKNGAGAVLPIKLGGTAQAPKFGLDMKGL